MRFRTILILLIGLLAVDTVLTSIAVGYLGATEMNPLYYRLGGLHAFIALKVLASAVAIAAIIWVERSQPGVAMFATSLCCGVYGLVLASNVWQVVS